MNKLSDCDGKPRNVGQATVYIFGVTSEPQSRGALSCTLTLDSDNRIEPNKFKIQFLSVDIRNPTVHFYIYDGEFNGRKLVCITMAFSITQRFYAGLTPPSPPPPPTPDVSYILSWRFDHKIFSMVILSLQLNQKGQ